MFGNRTEISINISSLAIINNVAPNYMRIKLKAFLLDDWDTNP